MSPTASLEIVVDHQRHVTVMPLRTGEDRELPVTTIAENQRRARVEFTVFDGTRRERLAMVELGDLPRNLGRRPRIRVHARIGRGARLFLRFEVEGAVVRTLQVSVAQWLPRRMAVWLVPAAVLVVGAPILLWLLYFGPEDRAPPTPAGEGGAPGVPGAPAESAEPEDGAPSSSDGGAAESSAPPSLDAAESSSAAESPDAASPAEREWTVYFRPDDPRLTAQTRTALNELIPTLREYLEQSRADDPDGATVSLSIFGHCAIAGTEAGRLELSRRRAGNVWRYLQDGGVPQPTDLTVEGFGARRPVTTDLDRQDLNRRVEIQVRCQGDC
jgi:outer membrane protein OmpA-like peptidoglycan-associated protein